MPFVRATPHAVRSNGRSGSSGSVAYACDLRTAARRALHARGYPALWSIEIDESNGAVVLRGRVPSYYLKQTAQAAMLGIEGVRTVRNLVEVA